MNPEDEEEFEYVTYLSDCNCEHEEEDHDWSSCTVETCGCDGHWEE